MNEAIIGSGWNFSFSAPCSSQNCVRHSKYSAMAAAKSARELMARMLRLKGLEGPKRFAYHGATLRKSREPCSSPKNSQ